MDAWRDGLGELFREIGPFAVDGGTAPVGIRMDSTRITTSWYNGGRRLPHRIVLLPETATTDFAHLDPGWVTFHTELTPLGAEWPWTTTRRYLVTAVPQTFK